jgi:hypothetical protein
VPHRLFPSDRPIKVNPIWKALAISPFYVPLMLYLFLQGIFLFLTAETIGHELHLDPFAIYNMSVLLVLGTGISVVSRVREAERWENFGLVLTILACVLAIILEFAAHLYFSIGDELFISVGCSLRVYVLNKARKAERTAIKIIQQEEEASDD